MYIAMLEIIIILMSYYIQNFSAGYKYFYYVGIASIKYMGRYYLFNENYVIFVV